MTTRLPCAVCHRTHRTHSLRIARGKWTVLCVSCHAALVRIREWHLANPELDVNELARVYAECVVKPAAAAPAAAKEKIA